MVAGHLQEKNGLYYIVLSYKDANGKRKTPWFATNLPVKGNKRRAEALLLEKRQSFLVPDASPAQADEGEDMLFTDFLRSWLPVAKSTIKLTTYASYVSMTQGVIIPYFQALGITLKKLTASDIQSFYTQQLERVNANTVIHYHAVIHRALKYAVKMDLISFNPADRIERPKKATFIGNFYDSAEINALFQVLKGHPLELPIKLAAFYGLRRSEVLGLKWNAIDLDANTLTIRHTVTSCNLGGQAHRGDRRYDQDEIQHADAAARFRVSLTSAQEKRAAGTLPQTLRAFLLPSLSGLCLRQRTGRALKAQRAVGRLPAHPRAKQPARHPPARLAPPLCQVHDKKILLFLIPTIRLP